MLIIGDLPSRATSCKTRYDVIRAIMLEDSLYLLHGL